MYKLLRKLHHVAVAATAASVVATATACTGDPVSQPTGRLMPSTAEFTAADAGNSAQNSLLATVRGATARYHDVDAALADGYVLGSPCEAMPGQGIGIHYRKGALIDGVVDPAQPELLVYEPQENGRLQLVAVAFVVRASAWDPTHNGPPMLGDQVFEDKRVPDWSSPPFPTYELHVWVWKHNPSGMYATTNPLVSCPE